MIVFGWLLLIVANTIFAVLNFTYTGEMWLGSLNAFVAVLALVVCRSSDGAVRPRFGQEKVEAGAGPPVLTTWTVDDLSGEDREWYERVGSMLAVHADDPPPTVFEVRDTFTDEHYGTMVKAAMTNRGRTAWLPGEPCECNDCNRYATEWDYR